ncbi:flagellar hook-length control protein FliK [Caballeronia sp. LjRoot34]|uniref:flagellar hook-length control protein FliK n=1 Tax=Caballeronia sp. LjRoot34 TaxID=3342325 RepID=UPI003ED06EF5
MSMPDVMSALIARTVSHPGSARPVTGYPARGATGLGSGTDPQDVLFTMDGNDLGDAPDGTGALFADIGAIVSDASHASLHLIAQPLLLLPVAPAEASATEPDIGMPLVNGADQVMPASLVLDTPAMSRTVAPQPQAEPLRTPFATALTLRMAPADKAIEAPEMAGQGAAVSAAVVQQAARAALGATALQEPRPMSATRALQQPPGGELALAAMSSSPTPFESDAPLKPLQPASVEPQQKLVALLGERISLHAEQGVQRAVIRLDPLMSGNVRIELRHEAGAIQIYLSATNSDVVRQLQAITDGLRQDLANRQFTDVVVHVSATRAGEHGSEGRQQRDGQDPHAQREHRPGRGLAQGDLTDTAFELAAHHATQLGH